MKITIEVNPIFLKVFNSNYDKLFKDAFKTIFDNPNDDIIFQVIKDRIKKETIVQNIISKCLDDEVKNGIKTVMFSSTERLIVEKLRIEIGNIILKELESKGISSQNKEATKSNISHDDEIVGTAF